MIERKFIKQNVTEQSIYEFVVSHLGRAGIGNVKLQLTPLGEKIIVYSSNPGLVVGKEGGNIKDLTVQLKKRFNLENPQIEISEVDSPNKSAQIVADRIAGTLERYSSKNFKGVMHRTMGDVINTGVRGIEIVLSGKLPGSRAKTWRILTGYMKKCGDVAVVGVDFAKTIARLKSGVVGVKVKIMSQDIILPDTIKVNDEDANEIIEEEIDEDSSKDSEETASEEQTEEKKAEKPKEEKKKKKPARKKTVKKTAKKSGKEKENDKEDKNAHGTEQSGTEEQTE